MSESLWGEIPNKPTTRQPATILKEQAGIFSDETNRILTAEVKIRPGKVIIGSEIKQGFENQLIIVAPALSNYRYTVLTVRHGVVPYPLEVAEEMGLFAAHTCNNEGEYLDALKQVLSSSPVRDAIASLMAQSQAAD